MKGVEKMELIIIFLIIFLLRVLYEKLCYKYFKEDSKYKKLFYIPCFEAALSLVVLFFLFKYEVLELIGVFLILCVLSIFHIVSFFEIPYRGFKRCEIPRDKFIKLALFVLCYAFCLLVILFTK